MLTIRDYPILFVSDDFGAPTFAGQSVAAIAKELEALGASWIVSTDLDDATTRVRHQQEISALFIDWDLVHRLSEARGDDPDEIAKALQRVNRLKPVLPILLYSETRTLQEMPLRGLEPATDFLWITRETPAFIAGRIVTQVRKYLTSLLPPFFGALLNYTEQYKYTWHTPGHGGGVAFSKSPAGKIFYNFFGENAFRSDLSVSVPELGSLLEHLGVVGEAERESARIFNADHTFYVTNGSSTSNKIIFHANITPGDVIIIDRNCHKSAMHAIIMAGAIPLYFVPSRNNYGIIGPIHAEEFDADTIRKKIRDSPLIKDKNARVKMAVVTNSTYDGLCYDVRGIVGKAKAWTDVMHFDEAWFGYANFHPIYSGRYGMQGGNDTEGNPLIFATHSTHKLLAAFSQASMIHAKDCHAPKSENRLDHHRFNEAYMMHTSTSPAYSLIASCDVAAKMMEGAMGPALMQGAIDEAIRFRTRMVEARELARTRLKTWWFDVWQSERVAEIDEEGVGRASQGVGLEPDAWKLNPRDGWHGFADLTANWALLDPIKVTILTPGIDAKGKLARNGIPAALVSRYLRSKGIVVEKTGNYSFLILFSFAISEGKSGTLFAELLNFKRLYDANEPLKQVFPELVEAHPAVYGGVGLKDLGDRLHQTLARNDIVSLARQVYDVLPEQAMLPAEAYARLVNKRVELCTLDELMNRVSAVLLTPYPPGIPMVMPGERFTAKTKRIIDYMKLCEEFDGDYPGFENEIHGVILSRDEKGRLQYRVDCVVERRESRPRSVARKRRPVRRPAAARARRRAR
jgi:lysine decarboxylase/arginine decarboxylase